MHGLPAGEVHAGGPERVVRRRDQHLVAVVQKGVQTQLDQFADAVAGIDVIHGKVRDVL